MKNPLLYIFLVFVLFSCSKAKTEKEKYEELHESIKYKTYRATSETTLPPAVKVYNESIKTEQYNTDVNFIRLLLGYNWAVAGQTEFAFAEADVIAETGKTPQEKFLGQSLRSIAMYEMGWDTLAKKESDEAAKAIGSNGSESKIKTEVTVFHLVMGTLYLKRKEYELAKFHFAGFGTQTGIKWPYQLCDAAVDIDRGDTQIGLKKLKVMSEDPDIPLEVRTPIAEALKEIEAQHGDVNSKFFWPKAIRSGLFSQLKNATDEKIKKVTIFAEDLSKKVNIL